MTCKHCGRQLIELGTLGLTDWYRCARCHHEVSVQIRDEGTYRSMKEAHELLESGGAECNIDGNGFCHTCGRTVSSGSSCGREV
jgi:hypothetical protein